MLAVPWPFSGVFAPGFQGVVEVAGAAYGLEVQDCGRLRLPSGRLAASDPFVNLGSERQLVVEVPPGDYPVQVTIADVSGHLNGSDLREAYLSVLLAEGPEREHRVLVPRGAEPPGPGRYHGVAVDAGTVAFADEEAGGRCMPPDPSTWLEDVFDNSSPDCWFALMDSEEHLRPGLANVELPLAGAGENIVLCHSGWGDGVYPLVGSYDRERRLLAVHLDLHVVGDFSSD